MHRKVKKLHRLYEISLPSGVLLNTGYNDTKVGISDRPFQ